MNKINDAMRELMSMWDLALPEALPDLDDAFKDIVSIREKLNFVNQEATNEIDKKKLTTVYFSYSFILTLKRGLLAVHKNRIERIKTIFLTDRGQSLSGGKQPLFEEEKSFLTEYKELLSEYTSSVMENAKKKNVSRNFLSDPIISPEDLINDDDEENTEDDDDDDALALGLTVNQVLTPPTLELAQIEIKDDIGEVMTGGKIRHFAKGNRLLISPEQAAEMTTKGIAKLLK